MAAACRRLRWLCFRGRSLLGADIYLVERPHEIRRRDGAEELLLTWELIATSRRRVRDTRQHSHPTCIVTHTHTLARGIAWALLRRPWSLTYLDLLRANA